jgi:hypothetical protein
MLASTAFAGPAHLDVPAMITIDENNPDACPSSATVMGLDPHGDAFLSILSGPGGSFREVGRLLYGALEVKD